MQQEQQYSDVMAAAGIQTCYGALEGQEIDSTTWAKSNEYEHASN